MDYFITDTHKEANVAAITKECKNCTIDTVMCSQELGASTSLQVKEGTKPYQVPSRYVAYMPQELPKKELARLHQ